MRLPYKMSRSTKEPSPHPDSSSLNLPSNSSSSTSNSSVSVVSLREIQIEEEFSIIKILAEGTYSKVYLAKKSTENEKLVLKTLSCHLTTAEEFNRELSLTYFLSPHPNIVTCYNVSFIWNNSYVFVLEQAPFGSLSRFLQKKGTLEETQVKLIAQQISSALEFIHEVNLVHRDVTPENVLVFKSNLSQVKLCDFGCTRPQGSLVTLTETSQSQPSWSTFAPPEICDLLPQERYHCYPSSDVWQMGILIFKLLTGSIPWIQADITDPTYKHYTSWLRRKSLKMPEPLKSFTPRFIRLLKRLLEPKPINRSEIREISKYLEDDWMRGRRTGSIGSTGSHKIERQDAFRPSTLPNKKYNTNGAKRNYQGVKCTTTTNMNSPKSDEVLKSFGLETEIDKTRVETWVATSPILPDEASASNEIETIETSNE